MNYFADMLSHIRSRKQTAVAPVPLLARWKQTLVIGIALFSMHFGAGNLILAPYIGARAGMDLIWVLLGFFISGVGLPIAALICLCMVATPEVIASHLSRQFSRVFTLLVYLTLGPLMIVPRTAACAYEMTKPVLDMVGEILGVTNPVPVLPSLSALIFMGLFFIAAYFVIVHPSDLTDIMGKISGPCLLVLMLILIGSFFFHLPSTPPVLENNFSAFSQAKVVQESHDVLSALSSGFISGYQTMDVFGAFIFGGILIPYIQQKHEVTKDEIVSQVTRSGIVAGCFMMLVYSGFAFIGFSMSGELAQFEQGAEILAAAAAFQFASGGSIIVAAIFTIACLNVCMTLSSAGAEYFSGAQEGKRFRLGLIAVLFISFVLANCGLTTILTYSVHVLVVMYPLAIILICFAFYLHAVPAPNLSPWRFTCLIVGLEALLGSMRDLCIPGVHLFIDDMPLAAIHLEWIPLAFLCYICAYGAGLTTRLAARRNTRI